MKQRTIAFGLVPIWERWAGWLLTGPVGHLAAGIADFAVLLWRLTKPMLARARNRAA